MSALLAALGSLADADRLWSEHGGASVRVRALQAVYYQGDPSDAVYLLLEGEVRATVSPEEGSEHTTLLHAAPAIFGDRDLLLGLSAQESVVALEPCRLLLFTRDAFLEAWSAQGPRSVLARDLAARYAASVAWSRLSQAPLAARLAVLIQDRVCAGQRMLPPPTYLAEALAVAAKSSVRALAELREGKVFEVGETGEVSFDESRLKAIGVSLADRAFHRFADQSKA